MGQFNTSPPSKGSIRAYQNIMETLVHQEIQRQLKAMPNKLVQYIDTAEVATFALNRLPPLYASSEQGRQRQAAKGQSQTLKHEVATAVRQALAAIQRDPLRSSTPLDSAKDPRYVDAQKSLTKLEALLRNSYLIESDIDSVTWDNLELVIARALKKTAEKGIVSRQVEQILTEHDYGRYTRAVHDWSDPQYQG